MELMSSLLFCALVVYLPQALGEKRDLKIQNSKFYNNSMMIHQMPMQKKILLNIHEPPLVNVVSDVQVVFMDFNCKQCIDCMERAIKASKIPHQVVKNRDGTDEPPVKGNRNKREAHRINTTTNKPKKPKSKKKTSKSVTVTKYNVDGQVYALKVKEMNTQENVDQQNSQVSTCQFYSVKKSFPCDTPEGDTFLTDAKRKVIKKSKKEKDRNTVATTTSTTRGHLRVPSFRKRQVDNSQVPENFMPSIEELY